MAKVTGIGGVFFKAIDAPALRQWYAEQLGIGQPGDESVSFSWR